MSNQQAISIIQRENNIPFEHCQELVLKQGGSSTITIGEIPKIKDKAIIGLYIPMQSKDANYQRSFEGKPLLNRAAMATAYISLKNNIGEQIFQSPMEHFGFDCDWHPAGQYKQIISPGNNEEIHNTFDLKQSKISLDTSKLTPAEEVILLCFIYLDPVYCSVPQI